MGRGARIAALGVLALLVASTRLQAQAAPTSGSGSNLPGVQVRQAAPISPLKGFVENRGQWHEDVRFLARKGGIEAVLLRDALVLHPLPRSAGPLTEDQERSGEEPRDIAVPGPPLTIRFPAPRALEGEGVRPTKHHFHFGSGSFSDVPGYDQAVYRDVAPGIDIVVRAGAEWFAYDLHVAPGADLDVLELEIQGATSAELLGGTVLALETSAGRVEQRIGDSWQVDSATGERQPVASTFRMLGAESGSVRFGFEALDRNPAASFVLDPTLAYATYVGASGNENFEDMDVSPNGEVLLVARSVGSPTTPGTFQPIYSGVGSDAWAGKLSPDGSALLWGTYVGGTATDRVYSGALDQDGTVVLVGETFSTNFPTTPGVLKEAKTGNSDVFITRLLPDGSGLVWSTLQGGDGGELTGGAAAIFPNGDVLVTAEPEQAGPPATPGAFDPVHDPGDHYLARISADGTQLLFLTYFRCSYVSSVVIDEDDDIYFAGYIFGNEQPLQVTPGVLKSVADGTQEAYVAKLAFSGAQLHWATYLGGDGSSDVIQSMTVDASGAVYVSGRTNSSDFSTTPGAFDTSSLIGTRTFVAKLLPRATGLVWSTYLTACCSGSNGMTGIIVDAAGSPITSGDTNFGSFPVTADAFQSEYAGGFPASDVHVSMLDAFGEALEYATYFGGSGTEALPQLGADASNNVYVGMQVASSTTPVTPGAYGSTYSGSGDMAAVKFTDFAVAPWRVLGGGLVGAIEVPNLAGKGALTPGSAARLSVRGARPAATALLVAGLPAIQAPFKGGTLVPSPTVMIPLGTTGQGALDLTFVWPSVPPGIDLFVQFWINDPGAWAGWSATNALQMTSQ